MIKGLKVVPFRHGFVIFWREKIIYVFPVTKAILEKPADPGHFFRIKKSIIYRRFAGISRQK